MRDESLRGRGCRVGAVTRARPGLVVTGPATHGGGFSHTEREEERRRAAGEMETGCTARRGPRAWGQNNFCVGPEKCPRGFGDPCSELRGGRGAGPWATVVPAGLDDPRRSGLSLRVARLGGGLGPRKPPAPEDVPAGAPGGLPFREWCISFCREDLRLKRMHMRPVCPQGGARAR